MENNGASKAKSKRKILTMSERARVVKEMLERGLTNAEACKKYDLHSSTVSTFWRNREGILKAYEENNINLKRMRPFDRCELDAPLYQWYKSTISQNRFVNVSLLQAQAKRIARRGGDMGFKCSDKWINGFKRRHNISFDGAVADNCTGGLLFPASEVEPIRQRAQVPKQVDVIYIEDEEEEDPIKMEEEASFTIDLHEVEDAYSERESSTNDESLNGATDARQEAQVKDPTMNDHYRCVNDETATDDQLTQSASSSDARSALHTLYTFYEDNYEQLDPSFFEHYAKLKVMVDEFHRKCDRRAM